MARGPLRVTRAGTIPRVQRPGTGTLEFLFRNLGVSKRRVMEELALTAVTVEPRLAVAVQLWLDLTPWQRRFVTLDDLAEGAGLTPGEFVGAISRASFECTGRVTDLIVAGALPDMVVASVKRALTPEGVEDRKLLLAHMGFFEGTPPQRSSEKKQTLRRTTAPDAHRT